MSLGVYSHMNKYTPTSIRGSIKCLGYPGIDLATRRIQWVWGGDRTTRVTEYSNILCVYKYVRRKLLKKMRAVSI